MREVKENGLLLYALITATVFILIAVGGCIYIFCYQ